ncbi:hypothetical protein H9Y04_34335 [Streptomyces sp. TRM66268-LWL]|uniref:Uncharacterized protein n=1 Tax=Streptomyces polyasparticus TaxID=2767826 RepID=A0ABR7STL1_9ACTN|nr:hypothetical protein [Streptomyces polyasparticus]MBC9717623.1 hypothetical protein [Streptomyces polyasparticus]
MTSAIRTGPLAASAAQFRSWAAGLLALALVAYPQLTLLREPLTDQNRYGPFGDGVTPAGASWPAWGDLLALPLPAAVCAGFTALVAGRLHRAPFRDSPAQHLLAALTVPLAAHALHLAWLWADLTAEAILLTSLGVGLGCLAGILLDLALD